MIERDEMTTESGSGRGRGGTTLRRSWAILLSDRDLKDRRFLSAEEKLDVLSIAKG